MTTEGFTSDLGLSSIINSKCHICIILHHLINTYLCMYMAIQPTCKKHNFPDGYLWNNWYYYTDNIKLGRPKLLADKWKNDIVELMTAKLCSHKIF